MIPVILLALACKDEPAPDSAAPAFAPEAGDWWLSWDATLTGDCALADMASRRTEDIWEITLETTGFTIYDETGYPVGCLLDGQDFDCYLGVYDVEYTGEGQNGTEIISARIAGTFSAADAAVGGLETLAECAGPGCAAIGAQYGRDFAYPCTSIAGFTAERR